MTKVFIATSIDGFIADKNKSLKWLESVPNPEGNDMGYVSFMNQMDALIMGRNTYETVAAFDMDWPYKKPVFVLSNSLKKFPEELADKVFPISGTPQQIIEEMANKGYKNLYIDGGKTIQSFLKADVIDELIISVIPILLGGGTSLFGDLEQPLSFELKSSEIFLNQITQTTYTRKR